MSRIVVGIQPVREALFAAPERVERVLLVARKGVAAAPQIASIARLAEARNIAVSWVESVELDRLARSANHQGAIAFAGELELISLDALLSTSPTLVVVLDQISDPQNFGAIIRSSVALGADAILWPEHANAPLSPATFRASAGAIEHARLCRVRSLTAALSTLRENGWLVVGLAGDAPQSLSQLDLLAPTALVIGSEGAGLRRGTRKSCSVIAKLPARPPIATLNASVSAAIAAYEVRRQRDAVAT